MIMVLNKNQILEASVASSVRLFLPFWGPEPEPEPDWGPCSSFVGPSPSFVRIFSPTWTDGVKSRWTSPRSAKRSRCRVAERYTPVHERSGKRRPTLSLMIPRCLIPIVLLLPLNFFFRIHFTVETNAPVVFFPDIERTNRPLRLSKFDILFSSYFVAVEFLYIKNVKKILTIEIYIIIRNRWTTYSVNSWP